MLLLTQGALAQMEVNAAAAMAKFKSFRTPAAAVKEPEKEAQPAASAPIEIEMSEATLTDPATDAAEAYIGHTLLECSSMRV